MQIRGRGFENTAHSELLSMGIRRRGLELDHLIAAKQVHISAAPLTQNVGDAALP